MDQFFLLQLLLAIINVASFTVFGVDKLRSKRGGWRIPESTLLTLAFFAPFGAFAGMLMFRHKTRKTKFLLVPLFLLLHVLLLAIVLVPQLRELVLNLFGLD